jgi:hypothetical protein
MKSRILIRIRIKVKGRVWRLTNGAFDGLKAGDSHHYDEEPDSDPHQSELKNKSFGGSQIEPLMVCKPMVEDSHHFYEAPDPDPHKSEKQKM